MSIASLVLLAAFIVGLRWLESAMTYHPVGYTGGADWQPPVNAEEIWFTDASGEQRHGWFVRTSKTSARWTILHCHGNGGNLTYVRWFAEALARHGCDTLIWDYRGYGRSDGKLTDEWGLYADGDAAYEWLARERGVRPERLILYGQSLGSTVAIDVATRKPAAALVIEAGLSSASAMAEAALPWLPRWLHGLGKNRFASAHKLPSVKMPVLLAHGTRDEIIPVAQSQTNYAAAPEPKELVLLEGGTHNLFGEHHRQIIERMLVFADRHRRP
jgi:hypothetical protein